MLSFLHNMIQILIESPNHIELPCLNNLEEVILLLLYELYALLLYNKEDKMTVVDVDQLSTYLLLM